VAPDFEALSCAPNMSVLLRARASGLELRGSFIVITVDADPAATALAPPGAQPIQRLSTARPGSLHSSSNTSSSNIVTAPATAPAAAAPAAALLPVVVESDGEGGGGGSALPRVGPGASLPRVGSGASLPRVGSAALAHSAADGLAGRDLELLAAGLEQQGGGARHALLFLGVPSLASLDEAIARGIYLSDIPLHGMGRDIMLLAESRTQASELAAEAERLAAELESERRRSDALLASMMPAHLAASYRASGYHALDRDKPLLSEDASVLMTSIEGFDELVATRSPLAVHRLLDGLYTRFDALLDAAYSDVFKVEHIDDAFLVVANATSPCARHADRLAALGFDFVDLAAAEGLAMRVGISSGPLAGGVIGNKCLRYRVFGDTVNLAARMNGLCAPRTVHVTAATRQRMDPDGPYAFQQHEQDVKGKGMLTTFTATRR